MPLKSFNKELLLDGKPQTLMFAEFHYYRTPKAEWENRLQLIIEAGFQGIASYIPWLLHEYHEDDFDFTGKNNEVHDLIGFIELIESYGLYFIPRPGPFIMAEMKNDGLPFWLSKKYPEIKPITWHHRNGTTVTVDYMNEKFLEASKKYYTALLPQLAKHIYPSGGIVALQLDNEVGMLSWVSNNPELNDSVIDSFVTFIKKTYHNPVHIYPFIDSDKKTIIENIRVPKSSYLNQFHLDLGHFFRQRLASYLLYLKDLAMTLGFKNELFLINIHGCSAGRSTTYPIGISQLYEAIYNQEQIVSGSDLYINDFDVTRFQDSYMANILTDAINNDDQVLTSLEFSAGTGDYGDNFSQRYPVSRIDFMTRSFVALGNKLLNFYTFVGGKNYRFNDELNDGNNRIATTGERHGFAAPIDPEGKKSYVFDKTKEVVRLMKNHANLLADQHPVFDDITYGFIPDYFMTEFHFPDMQPFIHQNLQKYRAGMFWDVVVKSLLLLNYNFDATDLQRFNPDPKKVLILPSATYMDSSIQQKIVDFLKLGGKLLLYGELPRFDMVGNPCQILSDYLELDFIQNEIHKPHPYTSSIVSKNFSAGRAELHRPFFQSWKTKHEKDVMFEVYENKEACGFYFNEDYKHAFIMTCEYHSDLSLFEKMMQAFNVKKSIQRSKVDYDGIFILKTTNAYNQGYYHIINLDDFDKSFELETENGLQLIHLEQKSALMLPYNLKICKDIEIVCATNEIISFNEQQLTIKLNGPTFKLVLKTNKTIISDDPNVVIKVKNDLVSIYKLKRLYEEKELILKIK